MARDLTEDLKNEALALKWENICFDVLPLILVKTIYVCPFYSTRHCVVFLLFLTCFSQSPFSHHFVWNFVCILGNLTWPVQEKIIQNLKCLNRLFADALIRLVNFPSFSMMCPDRLTLATAVNWTLILLSLMVHSEHSKKAKNSFGILKPVNYPAMLHPPLLF